ncbi:hypothetical protein NL676_032518 [Syzygium grande]|nr:hypothetical protein NL676_032518 [Syzygium grande]
MLEPSLAVARSTLDLKLVHLEPKVAASRNPTFGVTWLGLGLGIGSGALCGHCKGGDRDYELPFVQTGGRLRLGQRWRMHMSKLEIAANTGGCLKLGLFPGVCHVLFVTAYDLIGDRLAEKH